LPTDLLLGRVHAGDEMAMWLERHGVPSETLERLNEGAIVPDVLGLNYYPELSPRDLVRKNGIAVHVADDRGVEGLVEALRAFHSRYALPLMITETGVEGDDDHRARWLGDLITAVEQLREESVPVVGLTWWPLFDFVDWSWASGGQVVEEFYVRDAPGAEPYQVAPMGTPGGEIDPFLRRMGLYRLDSDGGRLQPVSTKVVDAFRARAQRLDPAI
jgi:hypothetical protein